MHEIATLNISNIYWKLFDIIQCLLHHCEKNDLIIWAEFTTLLQINKNRLLPNHCYHYGMFKTDYNKLVEGLKNSNNIIANIDYYQSDTQLAISMPIDTSIIVTIHFYDETNDMIVCQEKLDSWLYPTKYFYPLVKSTMCGHLIYLPSDINQIISINFPWEDSEPDTEFNVQFYQNIPKHHINDFTDLKNLIEKSTTPIILKNTTLLSVTETEYENLIDKQQRNIYGYQSSISWQVMENNAKNTWRDYLDNKLAFNVVDSPIDDKSILDNEWNNYVKNKLFDNYDFALTWILTNSPKTTHFHVDPDYAGGFMKLLSGEKIWWCVCPEDYHYLLKCGYTIESLAKMSVLEMIRLENNYLFGKIMIDIISDHDLIWFPIDTLHKVITTKHSYGFGGYL
ncbi:hypothetical protein [Megavirus chiliensis]|nr:putative histone demethylase [Megavirus chiliensis]AEQ33310.1 hypothetical protein [Megavirus chiliensis]